MALDFAQFVATLPLMADYSLRQVRVARHILRFGEAESWAAALALAARRYPAPPKGLEGQLRASLDLPPLSSPPLRRGVVCAG